MKQLPVLSSRAGFCFGLRGNQVRILDSRATVFV